MRREGGDILRGRLKEVDIKEVSVVNLLEKLCSLAENRREKIYFVGGVIRDLLLQRADALKDLDIVVEGDGAALAASFAQMTGGELKVFPKFLTAKVILCDGAASGVQEADGQPNQQQINSAEISSLQKHADNTRAGNTCAGNTFAGNNNAVHNNSLHNNALHNSAVQDQALHTQALQKSLPQRDLDFVSTRRELYPSPGSLPAVELGDFTSDIWRRDFSINALACPVKAVIRFLEDQTPFLDQVIDLTGGLKDLQLRRVRVLHDLSFVDDPTRLFRACRYAARVGGELEPHTVNLFQQALSGDVCQTVSYQRKIVEMRKLVEELDPKAAIKYVVDSGLLDRSGLISEGFGGEFLNHFYGAAALLQSREATDQNGATIKVNGAKVNGVADEGVADEISLWGMTQHLILYHALDVRVNGDERGRPGSRAGAGDRAGDRAGEQGSDVAVADKLATDVPDKSQQDKSQQVNSQKVKGQQQGSSRRVANPDFTKKAVEIATAFGWRKKMISQVLNELATIKVGCVQGGATAKEAAETIVLKDGVKSEVEYQRGPASSPSSEVMRIIAKVIAGVS